jgi:hypothetical protein
MPRNTFDGAIMSHTDVSTYYPSNTNFDHFVFQQVLEDTNGPDNTYTLCAYAVLIAGPPVFIPLSPNLNGKGYKAPKGVQFANMKLAPPDLAILYPSGVTADITITPLGAYEATDYVQYSASTPGGNNVVNSVKINPSPPY